MVSDNHCLKTSWSTNAFYDGENVGGEMLQQMEKSFANVVNIFVNMNLSNWFIIIKFELRLEMMYRHCFKVFTAVI